MSALNGFLNKQVAIITNDGKYFVGKLEGFDHITNIILSNTVERTILQDEDSIVEELGLYVIRGDLISCVGLIDEVLDKSINWEKVRGEPLLKTKKTIK